MRLLGADDWNSHWPKYAEAAAANPAQEYRNRLIARHVRASSASRSRVLDLGSGHGAVARALVEAFPAAEVAGLELSEVGVSIASQRVPSARFFQVDLLEARCPQHELCGWDDVAVCAEVLEHLDEPEVLLRHLRPYLAPGCSLVVTVPAGPRNAYEVHIGHRRHYTKATIRDLLEGAGYRVAHVDAAGFPFFNLYKVMGVLRGERLIADADAEQTIPPFLLRAALGLFRRLFRLNVSSSPWGWQLVAVATPSTPDGATRANF